MATIDVELQLNPLTADPSYFPIVKAKNVSDFDALVNTVTAANPTYSADLVASIAVLMMNAIQAELIAGNSVSLAGYMNFRLTVPGRIDDVNLPIDSDNVEVAINASVPWRKAIRDNVTIFKLPMTQKVPSIESVVDVPTEAAKYVDGSSIVRLSGQYLAYPDVVGLGVKWYNTLNDTTLFSAVVGLNSNAQILAIPALDPTVALNEHQVSVLTKYTENGSVRTGVYPHYVRSALTIATALEYPYPCFDGIAAENYLA